MAHIHVLRLSERSYRDERITTHCALVSRALGAERIYFTTEHTPAIQKTVDGITDRFGGTFTVEYCEDPKRVIKEHKKKGYAVAHLTMYGISAQEATKKLRKKNVLLIIGADKVPREIYELADFNISVTNQPHSEVGALAIVLYELAGRKLESTRFNHAKMKIVPDPRGKKIVKEDRD